jgi:hypothetical protein
MPKAKLTISSKVSGEMVNLLAYDTLGRAKRNLRAFWNGVAFRGEYKTPRDIAAWPGHSILTGIFQGVYFSSRNPIFRKRRAS